MPLSPAAAREPIHTRRVTCEGYRRADGLWDIEGHLTDVKSYAFSNESRGEVKPGEPVHDMWIRLTVDSDFVVREVEAVTDAAPFGVCPSIAPAFKQLAGLRIGPGWTKAVKQRLGGVHGCTHLTELLGPIATTAFQTIYPIVAKEMRDKPEAPQDGRPPLLLNSCHAFRSDGEVVRRSWPQFYTGGDAKAESAKAVAAIENPTTSDALAAAVALRKDGKLEESRAAILELLAENPADAELNYQAAWAHDVLGLEAEAIPFYEKAIVGELSRESLAGALLGLGSTYRTFGRAADAAATLERGRAAFPEDKAFDAFLAMARYDLGQTGAAMGILLRLLADSAADPTLAVYRRALAFYADEYVRS